MAPPDGIKSKFQSLGRNPSPFSLIYHRRSFKKNKVTIKIYKTNKEIRYHEQERAETKKQMNKIPSLQL